MTTKKLILNLLIIVVITCIITIIINSTMNIGDTIISNNLSIQQLENDDGIFVIQNIYHSLIKPCVNVLIVVLHISIAAYIVKQVIKFIKKEGTHK